MYERTAVLWTEDSATEGLFVIDAGAVRLTRKIIGDRQIVVGEEPAPTAIVTPGLFDGGPNCTTATAITDCVVHVLPRSRLVRLCHKSPDLLLKLVVAFSCRDRREADFLDLVTAGSVRQRVARLLLDVTQQSRSTRFELPHTQSALAQMLGTAREVVFRSLKQLQSEGVLRFRGCEIIIDNESALAEAAGSYHARVPVFDVHATSPTPCYVALLLCRH